MTDVWMLRESPVDSNIDKYFPEELLEKWKHITLSDSGAANSGRQQLVQAKSELKRRSTIMNWSTPSHACVCDRYQSACLGLHKERLDTKWLGPFQIQKALGKGVGIQTRCTDPTTPHPAKMQVKLIPASCLHVMACCYENHIIMDDVSSTKHKSLHQLSTWI